MNSVNAWQGQWEMWRTKAILSSLPALVGFSTVNVVIWYLNPEFYNGTFGFWFCAVQVVGLFLTWSWLTTSEQKKYRLAGVLFLSALFLSVASLVSSVESGKLQEWQEQRVARAAERLREESEEKKWSRFGTLSWQMPESMTNPLYTREDGNQFATNRVEILRNDNDIFEYVVFSRYGGIQTKSFWVKKDEFGRWWTESNKNIGRKPDNGEWYLEPDGPGRYRGAWRSQAQTGNRWVSMELRLEEQ